MSAIAQTLEQVTDGKKEKRTAGKTALLIRLMVPHDLSADVSDRGKEYS